MKKNAFFYLFCSLIIIALGLMLYKGFAMMYTEIKARPWEERALPNNQLYKKSFHYKNCVVFLRRDEKGIAANVFHAENGREISQFLEIIKEGEITTVKSEATRKIPKEQGLPLFVDPFQQECFGAAKWLPKQVGIFIFNLYAH